MERVQLDIMSKLKIGDEVGGKEDVRLGWRKEVASRGRSIEWGCWSRRGILFWRWSGGVRM